LSQGPGPCHLHNCTPLAVATVCTTPRLSCLVVSFCRNPDPKSPKMEDVGSVAADSRSRLPPFRLSFPRHKPRPDSRPEDYYGARASSQMPPTKFPTASIQPISNHLIISRIWIWLSLSVKPARGTLRTFRRPADDFVIARVIMFGSEPPATPSSSASPIARRLGTQQRCDMEDCGPADLEPSVRSIVSHSALRARLLAMFYPKQFLAFSNQQPGTNCLQRSLDQSQKD
jgi:hypothetical protein